METLDKEKFNYNLEERVRKLIKEYKLLENGEKVAIALSGGKDSILTMFILENICNEFNLQLVAISIDEGISGYREDGLETARKYADSLEIELIEKSFEEEFGLQLDQIHSLYKSACIPCGVFRRHAS